MTEEVTEMVMDMSETGVKRSPIPSLRKLGCLIHVAIIGHDQQLQIFLIRVFLDPGRPIHRKDNVAFATEHPPIFGSGFFSWKGRSAGLRQKTDSHASNIRAVFE